MKLPFRFQRLPVFKPGFIKARRRLPEHHRMGVDKAVKDLRVYFETGRATTGLGLKKIELNTYEIRAGIDLRVVFTLGASDIYLVLIGTHDEVRRFLKNTR